MEFRTNLRKLVDKKADFKQIDELFDRLDTDRSRELDYAEVMAVQCSHTYHTPTATMLCSHRDKCTVWGADKGGSQAAGGGRGGLRA